MPRDNILDTLDTMLDEVALLIVDGEDGVGKTTTLAEFARRHQDAAVSLFLESTNHWKGDLELAIAEIGYQVEWILGREPEPTSAFSEQHLRRLLFDLNRMSRTRRIIFVIDGLTDVEQSKPGYAAELLGLLPLGMPDIKFVCSPGVPEEIARRHNSKTFRIPTLSLGESLSFLADATLDRHDAQEIHRLCRGLPGHLAIIRRLLLTGATPTELLDNPDRLQDLFNLEWERLGALTDSEHLFLGILALDASTHPTSELLALSGLSHEELEDLSRRASFLTVEHSSNSCHFVSSAIRKCVAKRLGHLRGTVYDLLIQNLLGAPDPAAASLRLPTYFEELAARGETPIAT